MPADGNCPLDLLRRRAITYRDDTAIVEAIAAICEEFECYGRRRVRAALRQQGMFVNHNKIKRLMREHAPLLDDLLGRLPQVGAEREGTSAFWRAAILNLLAVRFAATMSMPMGG
jgi:HTH-like domain